MAAIRSHSSVSRTGENDTLEPYWIDRDKLARIERLELEQSGLVPTSSLVESPTRSTAGSDDDDIAHNELSEDWDSRPAGSAPGHGIDANGTTGTTAAATTTADPATHGRSGSRGPRSQSYDSMMDRASSRGSNNRLGRPGTSRIPVPRSAAIGSSVTSPEDRTGSTSSSAKKTSVSSLGPIGMASSTTGPGRSPGPVKKGGKLSQSSNRLRKNSNSGMAKRPGTGSGPTRLTPSKLARAPEGDPPWLDAFRPDPRLPPEEQLVPTVAKRQMQEKWKQQGLLASAYDANCEPLNAHDPFNKVRKRPDGDADEPEKQTDGWPADPACADEPVSRLATSDSHGGYRTIPAVSKSGERPKSGSGWPIAPTPVSSKTHFAVGERVRIPDPDDRADGKKGCCGGVCVVM